MCGTHAARKRRGEEGRSSTLDRSIGGRGLSTAPLCLQAPSSVVGERFELYVSGRVEIFAAAYESAHSATTRSNSPVDTSQPPSQGAPREGVCLRSPYKNY